MFAGHEWTPEEDRAVANRALPDRILAERIGRTYVSIQKRRSRLRGKAIITPVKPVDTSIVAEEIKALFARIVCAQREIHWLEEQLQKRLKRPDFNVAETCSQVGSGVYNG